MNTEDRLRRASREIERTTASLTPPPISDVRRSARMRGLGMVLASAAAVIVLIGGAVLFLNGGSSERIDDGDVAPQISAVDLVDLLVYPAGDPDLAFQPHGEEMAFQPIDPSTIESDLVLMAGLAGEIEFTETDELVVLGDIASVRLYLRRGSWQGGNEGPDLARRPGECLIVVEAGLARIDSCAGEGELDDFWWGSVGLSNGREAVLGHVAEGTLVVTATSPEREVWQVAREGYFGFVFDASVGALNLVTSDQEGAITFGPVAVAEYIFEDVPDDWSGPIDLSGDEVVLGSIGAELMMGDAEGLGQQLIDMDPIVSVLGDVDGYRAYVIRGIEPGGSASDQTTCLIVEAGRYSPSGQCDAGDNALRGIKRAKLVRESGVESSLIYGRAPSGSVAVLAETESDSLWQRTKDGYFLLLIPNQGNSSVWFTAYARNGEALTDPSPVLGSGQATQSVVTEAPDGSSGSCSAGDIAPAALTLSSVPQPVAETLFNIVDAARECDFDRLEAIGGDSFTASFGGVDPSEYWSQLEDGGERPMYPLMMILDMPYGVIETDNGNLYVWPSAYAHQGSWETTPEADVEALRSLYSEDDLQDFADFGGYFGYRVGIWENGDWSFFVAGD